MLSVQGQTSRSGRGPTRREILRIGALGTTGLCLPDLLRAEQSRGLAGHKAVIMIYLVGAPPHQDLSLIHI